MADVAVPREHEWEDYRPRGYTDAHIVKNSRDVNHEGFADPADVVSLHKELGARQTYTHRGGWLKSTMTSLSLSIKFDEVTGAPRNPYGRTGLQGRGACGADGERESGVAVRHAR